LRIVPLVTFALAALPLAGCDSCAKSQPEAAPADAAVATLADAAPINATALPTASVAALLNPDRLPAYAGPTGSVEGTITVTGDPAPETPANFERCPDAAKTYGRAFREGEPKIPGGPRWLADAIIAVTGYRGFYVREQAEAKELSIQDCAFEQRTVTMTFGQRLEVKNLTKDFWTPILEPGSNGVMMMAPPRGDAVRIYPKRPGYYRLVDHDRRYAVAEVYAFLHPLHTTSNMQGAYRIDGVPVGKLKVNTSHPAIPGVDTAADVDVKEGVVLRVDLTLEHKRPPEPDAGAKGRTDGGAYYPPLH
jgi:hypothetical protein